MRARSVWIILALTASCAAAAPNHPLSPERGGEGTGPRSRMFISPMGEPFRSQTPGTDVPQLWSSKGTLVGAILLTALALAATLLMDLISSSEFIVVAVVALLIIGSNAVIAVLLPYASENYRLGARGRGTGLIAGSSKVGGVAVQLFALAGIIPTVGFAAVTLIVPMAAAAALVALAGPETRGRSLRELERSASA